VCSTAAWERETSLRITGELERLSTEVWSIMRIAWRSVEIVQDRPLQSVLAWTSIILLLSSLAQAPRR